jgi:hypothetical protein
MLIDGFLKGEAIPRMTLVYKNSLILIICFFSIDRRFRRRSQGRSAGCGEHNSYATGSCLAELDSRPNGEYATIDVFASIQYLAVWMLENEVSQSSDERRVRI